MYDVSSSSSNKIVNSSLQFGTDVSEYVNPKWCKLVFKINSVGNLTLEATPSFTPGTLPDGVENGKVPAGTRIFEYDKKIILSVTFDDCINISEMSKRRFDYDDNGQINPMTIKPVTLFRNSAKFSKKMNIAYNDGGNGTYLVNWQFESTDPTGITTKFKLPMNLEAFDNISRLFESYANSFFIIKYFNAVEMDKINGGSKY